VKLRSRDLIVEVKQLDPADDDTGLARTWGTPDFPGKVRVDERVRSLLSDGYPQIKQSAAGTRPAMIVVYNNAGPWNWIDSFAVSTAMFGSFGIVLSLEQDGSLAVTRHGYLGQRKVTKDSFRALSAVGVLKRNRITAVTLECYHNPFARVRIAPRELKALALSQYTHSNPHARGFIPWEPKKLEIAAS